MYKKWDQGGKKLSVFSVPVLNQSKQTIAKANSPHTRHNPSSSQSLLAVSVWVFTVPEARSNTHIQIDFLIPPGEPVIAAIWHIGELHLTFREGLGFLAAK